MEEHGMVQVSHEYSSDLRQMAGMRAFLRDVCREAWGTHDSEAINQLEVALAEAAANIIKHAYQGEQNRPIELVIEAGADQVSVSLYHEGQDFDPDSVAPPAFDGSRESGFGVYLIKQTVDEVHYFCDARGRCGVRLVKKRAP